ncbi:MAG: thiolase family protein, partial [Candidatus Methylomirabilis sp.]|nr:thiolase family protein [Deltaproteobacteria bacterium]
GSGFEMNPHVAEVANPFEMLMGSTAEKVAKTYGVSRADQDAFAFRSHQKAAAAHKEGRFKDEIVPIEGLDDAGNPKVYETDQTIRADASVEKMGTLMPAFDPAGSVTAGNSSPLNDGSAALLLMSAEKAAALGVKPLAKIKAMAVAGVDPTVMGIGPVPAVRKALKRAGLAVGDIDLVEINEAFASQSLYCLRELGIPEEKANVNGGAIAIGHPLGCSGARILVTLVHEMKRRKSKYGLGTLCIGFGMGAATIVEGVH